MGKVQFEPPFPPGSGTKNKGPRVNRVIILIVKTHNIAVKKSEMQQILENIMSTRFKIIVSYE